MIMRLVMSDCEQNSRQKAPSLVKETPTPTPTMCSLGAQPGADDPAEGEGVGRSPVPWEGLWPGQ